MKSNQDMERVYELLEQFDFRELSDNDRNYVLSLMTAGEYNNLRVTVKDTEMLFSEVQEPKLNESVYNSLIAGIKEKNIFIRFLKRPVQLYKVAATVIVLTGLFSFIHFTNLHEQNSNSLTNDTIFIYKTDTVYSRIIDSVKHIREKVVYMTINKNREATPILFTSAKNEFDYRLELYPGDIDRIKTLYNNNIAFNTLRNN